jgi:hypothetical protein
VVEAVKANFDAGYQSAYKAAIDAMKEKLTRAKEKRIEG